MGFSYHGYGNVHYCWIQDGLIYEESGVTGVIRTYPTRLAVNIPRQLNLFASRTVAFLLYHEEKMYVGRFDGIISVYRESDNMLVGLNNWDVPSKPPVRQIGFMKDPSGLKEVLLDLNDNRTLYMLWKGAEGCLDKPFPPGSYTLADTEVSEKWRDVRFVAERGDMYAIDVWNIQTDVWRQNCKVFL